MAHDSRMVRTANHINDCVTYDAREHHVDFNSDKMYSRDELVRISTEVYGLTV